jgi:hypothetical protein
MNSKPFSKFAFLTAAVLLAAPKSTSSEYEQVATRFNPVLELNEPPQVIDTTTRQAADGTLTLKAADAELLGKTIKLETKVAGAPVNIGYWWDAKEYVQWQVSFSKPGTFEIVMEYACAPESKGSTYQVTIGDEKLVVVTTATKGWADFATATVGRIKVAKSGPTTVLVKPIKKEGVSMLNLRTLTLKPNLMTL